MGAEHRSPAGRSTGVFRACLIALLALQVGSGCASFRQIFVEEPVPPGFKRIALESQVDLTKGGELEGDTHSDSAVKGVTIGFALGGVTGGGIGFGVGVVTCVPTLIFYPICVIVAVAVGVVVGTVVGGVAGGSTGLPWKTTNQVNEALDRIQRDRNFTDEFRSAVNAAVPRRKQVSRDRADATVTARLDEVDLRQHFAQRLSMRMHASMVQKWPTNGVDPQTKTCKYVYTSPTMDVEDWLLHDGELFVDTFTTGMDSFAQWMARDLDAFSTRTPQAESGSTPATCFQIAN